MSDEQEKVIQEQQQANQRMIEAVERRQRDRAEGQAPANERIKQLQPNERTDSVSTSSDDSSAGSSGGGSDQES